MSYKVVIGFRYLRTGAVKDVVVQLSSGNGYFDDAGKRAVLKPRQLPPFPADISDPYKDIEMIFQVKGRPS